MQTKLELPAADGIAPEQIPEVMGKVAEYQAQLQIRLLTMSRSTIGPDRYLTAPEAAALLRMNLKVLYRKAKAGELSYAKRNGRSWRFSERGIQAVMGA